MASTDAGTGAGTTVEQHIREKAQRSRRYPRPRPMAPSEGIARKVILRRARLGLTQEEMAERLGTTTLLVARIERGQDEVSVAIDTR